MIVSLLASLSLLSAPTAAAEDSPWGEVFDFSPEADPDAPVEVPPVDAAPAAPLGEAAPEAAAEAPPSLAAPVPPPVAPVAPVAAVPPATPAAAPRVVAPAAIATPANALQGHRIDAFDPGSGVSIGQASVIGRHGGTHATTITARHRVNDLILSVGLPWASHRTAAGREVGLGNLQVGLSKLMSGPKMETRIGLEVTANLVDDMYTWANSPTDLWPALGGALVWQGQKQKNALTLLYRADAGLYKMAPYDPYPDTLFRVGLAAAADYSLMDDRAGLVGELSFGWWDTSPLELSAMGRVDPVDGLRIRGGFVFPLGVWAGATPARLDGAREVTLLADLSMAF